MTIDTERWLNPVQRLYGLPSSSTPSRIAGLSFFGSGLLLLVWTPSQVAGEPRRRRSLQNSSQWVRLLTPVPLGHS